MESASFVFATRKRDDYLIRAVQWERIPSVKLVKVRANNIIVEKVPNQLYVFRILIHNLTE